MRWDDPSVLSVVRKTIRSLAVGPWKSHEDDMYQEVVLALMEHKEEIRNLAYVCMLTQWRSKDYKRKWAHTYMVEVEDLQTGEIQKRRYHRPSTLSYDSPNEGSSINPLHPKVNDYFFKQRVGEEQLDRLLCDMLMRAVLRTGYERYQTRNAEIIRLVLEDGYSEVRVAEFADIAPARISQIFRSAMDALTQEELEEIYLLWVDVRSR